MSLRHDDDLERHHQPGQIEHEVHVLAQEAQLRES